MVNRKILIIFLVLVLAVTIALALWSTSWKISNVGRVKTIGVVCDTESIDWGPIEPGKNATKDIQVKSNGTIPVYLSKNTTNFVPLEAALYLTLSWNYTTGSLINSAWVPIKLTLSVALAVENVTSFSFDIILTGSES